jgi:hypothetical protein
MFPRLREQIGTALDLFVEFSTLGEYRLAVEAIPGASSAPADAPGQAPQLGGAGVTALRAAVRRTVAGGATGSTPVTTPAARRLLTAATPSETGPRPHRPTTATAAHRPATAALKPATAAHKPATAAHKPAAAAHKPATAAHKPAAACSGDRRRPSDVAARARVCKGAPQATEQLCLAV